MSNSINQPTEESKKSDESSATRKFRRFLSMHNGNISIPEQLSNNIVFSFTCDPENIEKITQSLQFLSLKNYCLYTTPLIQTIDDGIIYLYFLTSIFTTERNPDKLTSYASIVCQTIKYIQENIDTQNIVNWTSFYEIRALYNEMI
jgi:hypothetical protein